MIYFAVFIYLFLCVIIYDVCEKKRYFLFHYIVLFLFFTLIAGLRWRLGVDTVNYMYSFTYDVVSLSELSFEYIFESKYQPFWVLLNVFCKSVGDFTLLQMIVSSFFHLSVFSFFYRCCKKPFTALAIYFLYSYFYYSMEIMRESLAIACFLFGIMCLNKKSMFGYYIWTLCAFMFHLFAFFLFIIPLFFTEKISLNMKMFLTIFVPVLWLLFKDQILNLCINLAPASVSNKLIGYILFSRFGTSLLNINGLLYNMFPLFIITLFFFLIKREYKHLFNLNESVWTGCVLLYYIFLILSSNMYILIRFSNYMYMVVVVLYSSYLYLIRFNRVSQTLFIFVCFSLMLGIRSYVMMQPERIFDDYKLRIHVYAEYYPYTSVFEKNEPLERTIIHSYWGDYLLGR